MKYLSICMICLFFCCSFIPAKGQLIDYGQNPPGLHWQSLKTPHIELIYPASYSLRARRMAAILEKTTFFENHSLQTNTRQIPVILQNQGVESNGFVLLAPRRSEFYTLSPADQEPGDWLESLGLHEMRHVVQEDKVFGGHKVPLGETIQLGIFGLVFPPWFFEGDAVVMETALTASGRGRLPSFTREYRVNLLNGKNYSYSKYYFGSQRDNVPDYYRLGYFMVSKLRRDYSDSTYNSIFKDAIKPRLWPLSSSFKKHIGYSTESFFERTMVELRNKWRSSYKLEVHEYYPPLNLRKDSIYANYTLPHYAGKDSIIYLKTTLDDIPGIYLKAGGVRAEKLLTRTGLQLLYHFDYANKLLVWDEERTDPRYAYRTYSVIRTLNIQTGIKRTLTKKSRLFVPTLSADGKRIVAVHSDLQNRVELQILDASNGKILAILPAKQGEVFQYPRFDSSGNKIICISNSNAGKALFEFNLAQGSSKQLTAPAFHDLSRPAYLTENLIAYTYSGSIKEDIHVLQLSTGNTKILTRSSFGASAALPANGKVIFNDYQLRGDDIAEVSIKNLAEASVINLAEDSVKNSKVGAECGFVKRLETIESHGSVFTEQRKAGYAIDSSRLISPADSLNDSIKAKPYNEVAHLFHVHSILPDIKQVDLGSVTYLAGLELLSTNLLNTMQGYLGAYYDNNQRSFQYEAGLTYKKWYPWISLYLTDRKRSSIAQGKKKDSTFYVPFHYRELQYNLSFEVPLSFNLGTQNYQTGFQFLTYINKNYLESVKVKNFDRHFPLHFTYYLLRSRESATRDIFPTWSQNIAFSFEHLFHEGLTSSGNLIYMNSSFYFPGLAPHHSLQVSLNYQNAAGPYASDRTITEVNGFAFLPPNKLNNTLLFNYYFPLAYTDWELSSLAYVRSISGGLFWNSQNLIGSLPAIYGKYSTFGPEIRVDCNLLRYYLPVFQLGTRLVFFDKGISSPKLEFVLNYNL